MAKRSPLILGELKRWGWCVSLSNLYLSHRIFQKHFVIDTFFHNLLQVHSLFHNHKRRSFLWLSETGSFALDCHGIEHPKLVEERLRRPHSYGPACASLVTVIVLGTEGAFEETTVTEQMMDFLSSPIRVVSDTRNWFKTIRGASCSGECRICFS